MWNISSCRNALELTTLLASKSVAYSFVSKGSNPQNVIYWVKSTLKSLQFCNIYIFIAILTKLPYWRRDCQIFEGVEMLLNQPFYQQVCQ